MPLGSSQAADPEPWIEISIQADQEAVDDILRLLSLHCQGGAVVDQSISPISESPDARAVVKGFLPVWDQATRRKLEIALLLLSRTSPISEPRTRLLQPEDWTESWKAFFPPQEIAKRTVIVPTWETYAPKPGQIVIRLEPGMAFGTGLHATTRLCLEAIEAVPLEGACVLDVGTGSGVLAIAAALQGAASVVAIDTDQVAVKAALGNVALNAVQDRVSVSRGTLQNAGPQNLTVHRGTGYDLVLINILAEVIIRMAPALYAALRPGGLLIGSGIIEEKAAAVRDALADAGLRCESAARQEHWVSVLATRPL
jgi:ribosomal protein L11 methyltransferase